MTPSSIPEVAVTGWSWTTVGVGLLNLLVGGALVAWIKSRPQMRKLEQDADEKLRADLIARVDRLERLLDEERRRHDAEREQHEAAMALMRHRLNNSDGSFDSLLLILDDDDLPDRIKTKVARVRELRTRQREAEERERDTIRAAVVAAKTAAPITATATGAPLP